MPSFLLRALAYVLVAMVFASPAAAIDRFVTRGADKLVISGYDTTTYSKGGTPQYGDARYTVSWKGATWRFVTAEDAAAFQANPEAYAPQFGAYCTGALSQRIVVPADPTIWRIHKGKLYMFAARAGGKRFDQDPDAMISKAQAYWDSLGIKK